jgi:hypothetical protein
MNYFKGYLSKIFILSLLGGLMGNTAKHSNIIKQYDFEDESFSKVKRQHGDNNCSTSRDHIDNSLFKIVPSPGGRSGKSVKHHIKNCDERSEIEIPGRLPDEQTLWIGWSHYLPSDFFKPYPGQTKWTHNLIQQMGWRGLFLEQNSGQTIVECNQKIVQNGVERTIGAPGSFMSITGGSQVYNYHLRYYKGKDSKGRHLIGCKSFTMPVVLNQWEDFVMQANFSSDPNRGFLKIWKNDKLYFNEKIALMRPGIDEMTWKIGAYVGNPGHGERTIYTDEIRVGNQNSSFQEVAPKKR